MTYKLKKLAGASAVVIAALGVTPAFAGGTLAGSGITNTATINYQVGGVAQTALTATNTFTVDRKITLTVAELGTTTTSVGPGQAVAVTTFTVTNTSNAVLDFKLTAANLATGTTAPHTGTDAFDVTGVTMYVDTNGNNTYDAGTDTAVTYLDEVAIDGSKTVFVVAAVPLTATNGQIAAVSLTALAEAGGTAATEGAALTETTGANTAGMDTVFADTAGTDDIARDAKHSARDDYTIAAPVLTVSKISWVIDDPLNGTTNPKAIPGATVGYCIIISNAAGAAAATNVSITDPLPTQTTFVAGSNLLGGTTVAGPPASCTGGAVSTSSFAAGTVSSGTIPSIAAGATQVLWFRATVN
jgi:uncharacterized repeat protein (TIGR01451 family)